MILSDNDGDKKIMMMVTMKWWNFSCQLNCSAGQLFTNYIWIWSECQKNFHDDGDHNNDDENDDKDGDDDDDDDDDDRWK